MDSITYLRSKLSGRTNVSFYLVSSRPGGGQLILFHGCWVADRVAERLETADSINNN